MSCSQGRPRRRVVRRAVAAVLIAAGIDILTPTSVPLSIVGIAVILAGFVVFAVGFVGVPRAVWERRNELALALGTTVLSIGLVLVIALGLRLAPRKIALDHQRYDADLGWAADDENGTIGQRAQTIDSGRQHIVVVGDSILQGHGLATEQTAVHLLDDKFRSSPYQVLNLSVGGWSIDQYWLVLERELPRLHPKVIVVGVYSGNDFQGTNRNYSWGHTKPYYTMQGGSLTRTNPDLLAPNCIDHLAQSLLFRLLWVRKDFAQDLIDFFCVPDEQPQWQGEPVIASMFEQIEKLGQAYSAPVLFMLLSDQMDIPGNSFEEFYVTIVSKYAVLRRLLLDGGHAVFEYPAALVRDSEEPSRLFMDPGHYNAEGQRYLANALARELDQRYGIRP